MNIDFSSIDTNQRYFLTTQVLIPRPIAWVMTENGDGYFNLAPFSYFTAISSDPPLVLISIGKKPGGEEKDTYANLLKHKRCVIHIPSVDLVHEVNQSAASLPYGVSELDTTGLQTLAWPEFSLPRLASCRIAMGCTLYEVKDVGSGSQHLVILKVQQLYLDDAITEQDHKGRLLISAARMQPLARLGASEYASLGEIIIRHRP